MYYSGILISSFRKYLQTFRAIEVGSSSTLELVASFQFNWIRRHHKRPATAKPSWLNHFRTIIVHVFLYTRKWRGKSISSTHTLCESVTEGFYKEILNSPLEAIVVRVSNVSCHPLRPDSLLTRAFTSASAYLFNHSPGEWVQMEDSSWHIQIPLFPLNGGSWDDK